MSKTTNIKTTPRVTELDKTLGLIEPLPFVTRITGIKEVYDFSKTFPKTYMFRRGILIDNETRKKLVESTEYKAAMVLVKISTRGEGR